MICLSPSSRVAADFSQLYRFAWCIVQELMVERLARLCSATRFLLTRSVIASASVSHVHSLEVQHSDEEVDNSRGLCWRFILNSFPFMFRRMYERGSSGSA